MSFDLTNKNIQDTYQNLLQKTGSDGRLYDLVGNEVRNLTIDGTLTANTYITSQSITQTSSGSTAFGNDDNDSHNFKGHITASGNISSSGKINASEIQVNGTSVVTDVGTSVTQGAFTETKGGVAGTVTLTDLGTTDNPTFNTITANTDILVARNIAHIGDTGTQVAFDTGKITNNANQIVLTGPVTASGNISASGIEHHFGGDVLVDDEVMIYGDSLVFMTAGTNTIKIGASNILTFDGATTKFKDNTQVEGYISSSGVVYSNDVEVDDEYRINAVKVIDYSGRIRFGADEQKVEIDGKNIKLDAPVTASIISASSVITSSGFTANTSVGNITLGDIGSSVGGVFSSNDLFLKAADDVMFSGGTSGTIVATMKGDENQLYIHGNLHANSGVTVVGDISASGDLYLEGNDIYNDGTRKINFGSSLTLDTANGRVNFNNTDTSIASGDAYGKFVFVNNDNGEETAHIQVVATENHTSGDNGGSKYEFLAMPNATDTSDDSNFYTIATLDPNGTSGHLNVKGNISASGNIFGTDYYGMSNRIIAVGAAQTTFGYGNNKTEIDGINIKLDAPITASGNISSSGNFIGNELTLDDEINLTTNNKFIQQKTSAGSFRPIIGTDSNDVLSIGSTTLRKIQLEVATKVIGNITASGDISSSGTIYATPHLLYETSSISSTGNVQGDIVRFGNTTTVAGAIYAHTGSGWVLAHSGSNGNASSSLGFAVGTNSTNDGMLLRGMANIGYDPGGNNGCALYLETPGSASNSTPYTSGHVARVVGWNYGSDTVYFNPDNTWVEVS